MSGKMMYMHTLDGKPASFCDMHGMQFLACAGAGHRSRAAKLVPSRERILREQQQCIASDWKQWSEMNPAYRGARPSLDRYGYALVEVPRVR